MRPRHNDAKIAAVQVVAWRRLGAAGRMRVAADMSDDTRRVATEKIRRTNPSYSEEEVRQALAKVLYGDASATPSERRLPSASIALEDVLARLLAVLDATAVPFMLTGSLASTAHGVPRATTDLDVVIDPTSATIDALLASLEDGGWRVEGGVDAARAALAARTRFVVVDEATTWKADLVVRKDRPFSIAEFERRERLEVLGVVAWVASAEDTILSKLEWSKHATDFARRSQQQRDVAGVLASRGTELDRDYVDLWLTALDLEDEWRDVTASGA
jgi:hypothetical protein